MFEEVESLIFVLLVNFHLTRYNNKIIRSKDLRIASRSIPVVLTFSTDSNPVNLRVCLRNFANSLV